MEDMFDNDDIDDNIFSTTIDIPTNISNMLYIELLNHRRHCGACITSNPSSKNNYIPYLVDVITSTNNGRENDDKCWGIAYNLCVNKIKSTKGIIPNFIEDTAQIINFEGKTDSVLWLNDVNTATENLAVVESINNIQRLLSPSGILITFISTDKIFKASNNFSYYSLFNENYWLTKDLTTKSVSPNNITSKQQYDMIIIKRRPITCNEFGAIYWSPFHNQELYKRRMESERERINRVTLIVNKYERETGLFTDNIIEKGSKILSENGILIIPGIFDKQLVLDWGKSSCTDMNRIVNALKNDRNIDLLSLGYDNGDGGGKTGQKIENFHEMSMREPLRCDLRNGIEMKHKNSSFYPNNIYDNNNKSLVAPNNLRFHPGILSILSATMNPQGPDSKGDWGKWNFEGKGPDGMFLPKVGQVGVVMSLPGCVDQTIHADTSHLFSHVHLPPHYLNLFIPGISCETPLRQMPSIENKEQIQMDVDEGYLCGQTAYVLESHRLRVSAAIMTEENGQYELEERIIRPHLQAGDALIFDCRILHFGLANRSDLALTSPSSESQSYSQGWRPMLYVNYHHSWFHDPKNWNDAEKLFP
eukprot:gene16476-22480_t